MTGGKTKPEASNRGRVSDSFVNAGHGVKEAFARERNVKVFTVIAVIAIVSAAFYRVSNLEWLALVIVIGLNFVAEMFNTALETLCDKVSPKKDPKIRAVKDISAAAVLIFAITAAAVGFIIFIPRTIDFLFLM
jgi:diacylglycerol kinase (ATP)